MRPTIFGRNIASLSVRSEGQRTAEQRLCRLCGPRRGRCRNVAAGSPRVPIASANQSFCLYFYADALRQNVLVARTYSWSFLIYPDAPVRAERGFMESGGRKTEAAGPSGGMLRTALNPAISGSCEAPVIIEAMLNPDGRSEVESPMSDRRGPRRRTAAPPIYHIRRMKLETANPRNARATLRDVIREFMPNWFSVTMGTGALALA